MAFNAAAAASASYYELRFMADDVRFMADDHAPRRSKRFRVLDTIEEGEELDVQKIQEVVNQKMELFGGQQVIKDAKKGAFRFMADDHAPRRSKSFRVLDTIEEGEELDDVQNIQEVVNQKTELFGGQQVIKDAKKKGAFMFMADDHHASRISKCFRALDTNKKGEELEDVQKIQEVVNQKTELFGGQQVIKDAKKKGAFRFMADDHAPRRSKSFRVLDTIEKGEELDDVQNIQEVVNQKMGLCGGQQVIKDAKKKGAFRFMTYAVSFMANDAPRRSISVYVFWIRSRRVKNFMTYNGTRLISDEIHEGCKMIKILATAIAVGRLLKREEILDATSV